MPDWRIEQLRLTLFIADDLTRRVPPWWREIIGEEPPNQSIQGGLVALNSGSIRDNYCQLALQVHAGRIDWFLMPVQPSSDALPSTFPSFDTLPGGLAIFRELMLPWVQGKEARRIALGMVLTNPTEGRIVGYEALQRLLPALQIDARNSSDLLYQINRHTQSRHLPGLQINRLSQWSIAALKLISLQISGAIQTATSADQPEIHAIRLQLDINTDAERVGILPSGIMGNLLEELLGLGEAIAEHGDQP